MDALINSFLLVFAGEIGDKTQLLTLILAARYGRPWLIMTGILIATIANHAVASWVGGFIADFFSQRTMAWILAITFFVFAAWILIPDKEEEVETRGDWGVLATTVVMFFLAEMGDKTQLATIGLGARYKDTLMVTMGSTAGMMAANAMAVVFGKQLLTKLPMSWVRRVACALFAVFGVLILVREYL